MPDGAPECAATPPVVDYDLPCEECDYNLRGLSGDPVRCPECGYENALGIGAIPDEQIEERLKYRETSLTLATAGLFIALLCQVFFWLVLGIAVLLSPYSGYLPGVVLCLAVPAFVPLALWGGAVKRQYRACARSQDAARTLVRYHLLAFGSAGAVLAVETALGLLLSDPGRELTPHIIWLPLIAFVALLVAIYRFVRPAYRKIANRLGKLQRDDAIAELRTEARERTHHD